MMFGRLADLYGRKKMFIGGMIWLTVFSLGVGFANSELHCGMVASANSKER